MTIEQQAQAIRWVFLGIIVYLINRWHNKNQQGQPTNQKKHSK